VADNGFDDVTPVEQRLVEERNRQPLHVAAHLRHQGETAAKQSLRETFADVASVANSFSDQILGQVRHRRRIADVTRSQFERGDLAFMVIDPALIVLSPVARKRPIRAFECWI
jgi:hypothetical protein